MAANAVGVEGGAADQGAIHVGLGEEPGGEVGGDAAAVQDAHRGSAVRIELGQEAADERGPGLGIGSVDAASPVPMAHTGS